MAEALSKGTDMIRMALSLVLMLLVAGAPALAQTDAASQLSVGDKVRVRAQHGEGRWWVGTVTALSTDTLWMQRSNSPTTLGFAFATTGELEVSRGKKSNFLPGLLLGTLGGAAFFGTVGLLSGGGSDESPPDGMIELEANAFAAAAVGAAVGAVLGGFFGALSHRDRWAAVQLDRVGVDVSARYDGRLKLAFTYGF